MDTTAAKFEAANKVFTTYELVALILPHLDALSLDRVQGVDVTFRSRISQSTQLRKRIGYKAQGGEVIDTASINTHIRDWRTSAGERLRWDPLLDWLVVRSFTSLGFYSGPIDKPASSMKRAISFLVLPHAWKAG